MKPEAKLNIVGSGNTPFAGHLPKLKYKRKIRELNFESAKLVWLQTSQRLVNQYTWQKWHNFIFDSGL